MSNCPPNPEPRSRTILRHTRQAVADSALKPLPFSERVADRYLATTAPEDRVVPLREQGDTMTTALAAKKHNGVVVDRLIKGVVKTFPADLEDAWVCELPLPYRQRCEHDLAARRGLVPIKDPRAERAPSHHAGELAALLKEAGEACVALAPITANGVVGADDEEHIGPALVEVGELLTAALQIHHSLTAAKLRAIETPAAANVTPMRGRGLG